MFQFRITCPHCANQVDLAFNNLFHYRIAKTNGPVQEHFRKDMHRRDEEMLCYGAGNCSICEEPCLAIFRTPASHLHAVLHAAKDSMRASGKFVAEHARLEMIYPEPPKPADDPSYPKKVRELFPELQQMAGRGASPSIVVGGCRSVLEVACVELGGEGKSLQKKIDSLLEKGVLTQPLAEWSHRLRLDGNAAVHEIDATPEQAKELVAFARLFLEVTFALPARIRKHGNS